MTPTIVKKPPSKKPPTLGPTENGILLTPEEFDTADFVEGWRYELIHGVLIVSPIPGESEADPHEELGYWLRSYKQNHPQGVCLDSTLPERTVRNGDNRRLADRLIWAGLGRLPRRLDGPAIVVEFVSSGRRNRTRDYQTKRDEYQGTGVKEYWVIDRFDRCMVVFTRRAGQTKYRVVRENQTYKTRLLPGFELPLLQWLTMADAWIDEEDEANGTQE